MTKEEHSGEMYEVDSYKDLYLNVFLLNIMDRIAGVYSHINPKEEWRDGK